MLAIAGQMNGPNEWSKCAEFLKQIDFLSDGVNL